MSNHPKITPFAGRVEIETTEKDGSKSYQSIYLENLNTVVSDQGQSLIVFSGGWSVRLPVNYLHLVDAISTARRSDHR